MEIEYENFLEIKENEIDKHFSESEIKELTKEIKTFVESKNEVLQKVVYSIVSTQIYPKENFSLYYEIETTAQNLNDITFITDKNILEFELQKVVIDYEKKEVKIFRKGNENKYEIKDFLNE